MFLFNLFSGYAHTFRNSSAQIEDSDDEAVGGALFMLRFFTANKLTRQRMSSCPRLTIPPKQVHLTL